MTGAHRGLSAGMPENTMAAFEKASADGASIIELDLRQAADGSVWVMHDPTVDRTTDGSGQLSSLTAERIRTLDAGRKTDSRFIGERVPSLDDVLAFAARRQTTLLLDIKQGGTFDLARLVDQVKARNVAHRIIVGVRSVKALERVRAIDPAIRTLAFSGNREELDAFILAGVNIARLWSDWVEQDPDLVAQVRAAGAEPWILVGGKVPHDQNSLAALHRRMACAGAGAVITDWPELLPGKPRQ